MFWLDDPTILWTKYINFFPTKEMSPVERLNNIVRLSIYISIALILIKRSIISIFIALTTMIISVIIYRALYEKDEEEKSAFGLNEFNEPCTMPTPQNPFMNVTLDEIQDNPNRPPACNPLNPEVQEKIEDAFSYNQYRNVDDLFYEKEASLNFWTNPSTTIPNDRHKFISWLAGDLPSCKEDSINCYRYKDLRQSRREFVDPYSGKTINPI